MPSKYVIDYAKFYKILSPVYGTVSVGDRYLSPIPAKTRKKTDSKPSLTLYKVTIDGEDRLKWRDWGFTAQKGGSPEHLLHYITGHNYSYCKDLLSKDLNINIEVPEAPEQQIHYKALSHYTLTGREYWDKRLVPKHVLAKYKVRCCDTLQIDNKTVYNCRTDKPAFIYEATGGWQFYSPEPKWFLRQGDFILGYDQLDFRCHTILIVSGMKDGLCLHTNTGWGFVSGSGEGDAYKFVPYVEELKSRADYVGILHDPDIPGVEASKKASAILKLPIFAFEYPDTVNDIADLTLLWGKDKLHNELLKAHKNTWG